MSYVTNYFLISIEIKEFHLDKQMFLNVKKWIIIIDTKTHEVH